VPSRALRGFVALGFIALVGLSGDDPGQESARPRLVPGRPDTMALGFALSPDGRTIATARSDGLWSLRGLREGHEIERLLGHRRGLAWTPAFSPDGRLLVLGKDELGTLVLDLSAGGAPIPLDLPLSAVKALAFSPDGWTLAAASGRDGEMLLWDLATDRQCIRLRGRFTALSLAFSPDG
jgi:WD40 repeat protein